MKVSEVPGILQKLLGLDQLAMVWIQSRNGWDGNKSKRKDEILEILVFYL